MQENEINYRFVSAKALSRLRCSENQFSNNIVSFDRNDKKSTFLTLCF